MTHDKKERNTGEPKPLDFEHNKKKIPTDRSKKPFMSPADKRGDDENEQYYEEEEALSPEEAKLRKQEGNL